jgi:hypothetical protein
VVPRGGQTGQERAQGGLARRIPGENAAQATCCRHLVARAGFDRCQPLQGHQAVLLPPDPLLVRPGLLAAREQRAVVQLHRGGEGGVLAALGLAAMGITAIRSPLPERGIEGERVDEGAGEVEREDPFLGILRGPADAPCLGAEGVPQIVQGAPQVIECFVRRAVWPEGCGDPLACQRSTVLQRQQSEQPLALAASERGQ